MKGVITHKRINNTLAALVALAALYIFVLPFMPAVSWWVKHDAPLVGAQAPAVLSSTDSIPADNTLVIPKIDLRTGIHGGSITSLNKGAWHIPDSGEPDLGGNTVIAGHRFTYSGSAVFYNLDKVQKSDMVYVYWEGKRYEYIIEAINVVPPTDTSLVAPTHSPILTIYTCTPVWSAKDRLVITARLVVE